MRFTNNKKLENTFDILLNGFSLERSKFGGKIKTKDQPQKMVGLIKPQFLRNGKFFFQTEKGEMVQGMTSSNHTIFQISSKKKNLYDEITGSISLVKNELKVDCEVWKSGNRIFLFHSFEEQVNLALRKSDDEFLEYNETESEMRLQCKKYMEFLQEIQSRNGSLYEDSSDFGPRVFNQEKQPIDHERIHGIVSCQSYQFIHDMLSNFDRSYGNLLEYMIRISNVGENPNQYEAILGKALQYSKK